MLFSNVFKVFKYLLLPHIKNSCTLGNYQFGYRDKTSTIEAACVLKEVLEKYKREGYKVYSCSLDMSKAFEQVEHDKLLKKKKLEDNKDPPFVTSILEYFLANSFAAVQFNGATSRSWGLTEGVRQYGVLSAHPFCVYLEAIFEKVAAQDECYCLEITMRNVHA